MAEFSRLQGGSRLQNGDFRRKFLRAIEKFFRRIWGDFWGSGALAAGGEKELLRVFKQGLTGWVQNGRKRLNIAGLMNFNKIKNGI